MCGRAFSTHIMNDNLDLFHLSRMTFTLECMICSSHSIHLYYFEAKNFHCIKKYIYNQDKDLE